MISLIRSLADHLVGFRKRATHGRFMSNRVQGYLPLVEILEGRDAPATFDVANLNNAGADSLRRAIDDLNASTDANNRIVFPSALTGTLCLAAPLANITKSVEIVRGPGAPQPITITRTVGAANFPLLSLQNFASPSTVVISGFTFSGNTQEAIFADGLAPDVDLLTNLTVRQCTFRSNASTIDGGAIAAVFVTNVNIVDCAFNGNSVDGYEGHGGAIYDSGSPRPYKRSLTITNTNFNGNTAAFGAAVSADVERLSIRGGTFSHNTATHHGGAVFYDLKGQALRSRLSVTGTLFFGNIATSRDGGAIWNGWGTPGSIQNSTFLINGAGRDGGAVYDPFEDLDSINNTFYWNGAATGGGLYVSAGATGNGVLANTIFYADTAQAVGCDVYGTIISRGHNLIGKSDGSSGWQSSDFVGTSTSPIDPKLNPLGFYGGTVQTMTLQPNSAAIGNGDPNYATMPTDERGNPRTVNGAVDIGAVEMQPGESSLTSPYAYNFTLNVMLGSGLSLPAYDGDYTLLDYSGNSGNSNISIARVNGFGSNVGVPTSTSQGGLVTITGAGLVTYVAPTTYTGDDSVTYTTFDGTNYSTGTITFHLVNILAPDASYSTPQNTQLTVSANNGLLQNIFVANGATPTLQYFNGFSFAGGPVTIDGANGSHIKVYSDGSFVYTPAANSTYEDVYTFTISDGTTSVTANLYINVG